MAKAAKGLHTLIRLAKFDVDEKRRVLTALQNQEDTLLDMLAQGEAQTRHEQQVSAQDATGVGFAYGAYYRAWMARREQINHSIAQVRQMIEAAQEELAEAFRVLKTYELTQANREKREAQEAARKEQIFLDEVAQTQFRRKEETA